MQNWRVTHALASDRLADNRLNDPVLLRVRQVIEEGQAHQLIADALSDRTVARFTAEAHAHIRKVQGQVMENGRVSSSKMLPKYYLLT